MTEYTEVVEAAIEHAEKPKRTAQLLEVATELGVTAVSIDVRHPSLTERDWPHSPRGCIFTPPDEYVGSWPAAWAIADRAGISRGAGSTGSHQADTSGLVPGIYEHRGGQWTRFDEEEI
ncbi:hypothetical protein H7J07_04845 [Mycobacterium koreense]|uniref:hypothetical protein n=1 Tax=Mycolicibacillus koreensis TaxID=1069220 RepID=UPI0010557751|nr:hypothetical protein [Mycolicibacillus koreensis]MCV7247585.1 hypothetical protein [Mycolicibacillus koreensis]BBY53963.1 hypothetical protein MKOR_12140 [Mycolicibacillus koreensis]